MARVRLIIAVSVILMGLSLSLVSAFIDEHYMLLSMVFVILAMTPFFLRFEQKEAHARELVLMAVLIAVAAVARVPFAALPSVQPTTFVVIVSALAFGAESGFMIGALAALVSNMFLGQGPWTPWQMFGWGMIGLTAGMLRHIPWMHPRWMLCLFGFVWGFLYGWIMNLFSVVTVVQEFSWPAFFALYAASIYFDLLHGLGNVIFLALFAKVWLKILERFKRKYGLLMDSNGAGFF